MRARTWSALSSLLLVILACGVPEAAAPTAAPPPTQEVQPTQAPPTEIPATPTTAPPVIFRDDFDGALAPGWQWLGEDPTHWDLTSTPGHVRIVIQRSNISDGEPRNFLVREAPAGNFEITTSLRFTPAGAYQVAGLLVYQTQGNALQFGPAYAACPGGIGGQCVYYDNFARGQWIQPNFATFTGGGSPAYLKLRRMGSSYTASYSADGSTWKEIGTHQNDLAPAFVGLVAAQGYASEAPADFDYFTLEEVR